MQSPALPPDEKDRLAALHSLHLLDTAPEERFDRLTRIARRMFSVPIAVVNLIDAERQWAKSAAGPFAQQTSRESSFCGHTILGSDVFCINDAHEDSRFQNNPLVAGAPSIRFYAGYPLRFAGHNLGALCLLDTQPRSFSPEERDLLIDLARMVEAELASEHEAATDELTGLANRRGFEQFAQKALGVCARAEAPATLVYCDLDGFKPINDAHGHAEGDRALQLFARVLADTFRDSDFVARLGGDEFAVLLTNSNREAAEQAIYRMRMVLEEAVYNARLPYPIRFSAGIAEFDRMRHRSADQLLREADAAMYAEKKTRR